MYPKAAEYLQPIRWFGKLCGTFPATVADSSVSQYYVAYCLFLLVVPAKSASVFYVLYYEEYKDIVVFATELFIITKYAVHFFSVCVPLLETNTYRKLFKKLCHAEKMIHSMNINQTQPVTKCRQYFVIIATLLMLFGLSADVYTNPEYTLDVSFGYFIVYATFFSYLFHVIWLLVVVRDKMDLVNWHLDYLTNGVPAYLTPPDDSAFIERKLNRNDAADKFLDVGQDTREVSAFKLKRYNQIHFLLWSSCNMISEYFSLQNFGCLLQTSLMVVKFFLFMFEVRDNDVFGFLRVLNFFITGYSFCCIYVVAKLCNDIICESKRTALLVHQLLDENCPDDDCSDEVTKELEAFSKQLMLRKIRFTGFDFFDIDLKMITSVVCIVLPVSLFLVQYNSEQHKPPRKLN